MAGTCHDAMCADQSPASWGWFSPSTFMLLPGIELKSSDLSGKHLNPLSHFSFLEGGSWLYKDVCLLRKACETRLKMYRYKFQKVCFKVVTSGGETC